LRRAARPAASPPRAPGGALPPRPRPPRPGLPPAARPPAPGLRPARRLRARASRPLGARAAGPGPRRRTPRRALRRRPCLRRRRALLEPPPPPRGGRHARDGDRLARPRAGRDRPRAGRGHRRAARGSAPDPDEDTVDGEPRTRFQLRCPRRVRRLWRHAAELASRMSGARLSAWRAAEAIAAEGLASEGADAAVPEADPSPDPAARTSPPLPAAAWEAIAEALPADVERLALDAD